jgi:cob(I)alamin adenosyltransferase
MAINRVYTGRGDAGQTSLVGGQRVAKDAQRIEAYGTVDELNAFVGAALVEIRRLSQQDDASDSLSGLYKSLRRVQHELFNLGAVLATPPDKLHEKQPRIRPKDVAKLESEIDEVNETLPALRSFVLPGGSELSVRLHQCRTICRRAERICVSLARAEQVDDDSLTYLNRLSDALFVWSRQADQLQQCDETLWDPNEASSVNV